MSVNTDLLLKKEKSLLPLSSIRTPRMHFSKSTIIQLDSKSLLKYINLPIEISILKCFDEVI